MRILLASFIAALCLAQAPPTEPKVSNPAFQALLRDAKTRIKEITPEQLKELVGSNETFMLIDVREDAEWAAGRAAGSVHIGRGVLEPKIEAAAPNKATKIVLYCMGGFRSALAADTLQKMGYTNVYSLAGGFLAYRKLGLPVASPPQTEPKI